ncbi:MAG: NAD(+) synthase [Anaplasma sp.]
MTKIFIGQFNHNPQNVQGNFEKILTGYIAASDCGASVALFSRYAVSGYIEAITPSSRELADLYRKCIDDLALYTLNRKTCAIISSIEEKDGKLLDEVVYLLSNGVSQKLMSVPTYMQDPQGHVVFHINDLSVALLLEPSSTAALEELLSNIHENVDLLVLMGKSTYGWPRVLHACRTLANKSCGGLAYVNLLGGYGGKVFAGGSMVCSSKGVHLCPLWEEKTESVECSGSANFNNANITASIPISAELDYGTLVLALRDYVHKSGFVGVTMGMSGGIDSALVATIAADALGPQNVHTFMLSTRYTPDSSINHAAKCAANLGVHHTAISIESVLTPSFEILNSLLQDSKPKLEDATEENIQSRIRGIFLMAVSNRMGVLPLSTGNKSELLTGYVTLYGDTCGGFAPIKDVYKTRVYELVRWRNSHIPAHSLCKKTAIIPEEIVRKPPSAELKHNQRDEDALPEYSVLDRILHLLVDSAMRQEEIIRLGFDADVVELVVGLVKKSSFKLQQVPPGPCVPSHEDMV